jgi:uncharacterized protein (DUF4415 family)
MSVKHMKARSGDRAKASLTNWTRLDRQTDREIAKAVAGDPDTFEESARWIGKMGRLVASKPKERLTVRFDTDVVDWFRGQGRGYQTRMNAVLRSYFEHVRKTKRRA